MILGGAPKSSLGPAERNAEIHGFASNTGPVAPHGLTTRATYTVPTARIAMVNTIYATANRESAAGPVGRVQAQVFVQDAVPNNNNVFQIDSISNTVTVLGGAALALTTQIVLGAGGLVRATDSDAGTGGTVTFIADVTCVEYAA